MTKPLPRHQCPRHPWAWVSLAECGGSEKPRHCNHCRDEGRGEVEMVLLTDEPVLLTTGEPPFPAQPGEPDLAPSVEFDADADTATLFFVRGDGDHLGPMFNWSRRDLERLCALLKETLKQP